jgi:anaerobic selenocysteine-containing dehydrogenase
VLPSGLEQASVLWGACQICAQTHPESIRRAGFQGEGAALGNALFEAVLASPRGLVFTVDDFAENDARVQTPEGRIQLWIPELADALAGLDETPSAEDPEYPFWLSAGERRSFTANTIFRDPRWRKKDAEGALFMSPDDGAKLGVEDGGLVRVTTRRGQAEVRVALSDRMQAGHVSLPNGLGLDAAVEGGAVRRVGVAPNELTRLEDRDPFAGTPWHKRVPARIEPVA